MRPNVLSFALIGAALLTPGSTWAQAKGPRAGARGAAVSGPAWISPYQPIADRILATTKDAGGNFAWDRLAFMTDTFGPRLSGSANLDATLRWAEAEMKKDGLENVRLEPVMAPQWIRGDEGLEILEPFPNKVPILGLGGSVSTRSEGVTGELMIVKSFDELNARKDEARGRIVLFNVLYTNYGETVRYRGGGASAAAKAGAVAALVRSVGLPGLRTPHTGGMRYEDGAPKIPTAAIPTEDADRFDRMAKRGQKIVLRLKMDAHFLDDAPSANLVGEIRGTENPDEVVLLGGHIDSWDPGTGAMDDGGGCVVTWEALRILKNLGLRPKRTIRVVLFTNEENGGAGGNGYRDAHKAELDKHVLALESDSGVFRPRGFGFTGSDAARQTLSEIAAVLKPLGADVIGPQGGGADIGPSVAAAKIPSASLEVDGSRYFLLHHTPADTVDKLDPKDLADNAAAIAFLAYVVADLEAPLQRP
ncbi:MAG: M20/M25/M40 family metallo-hydrolase [Vicinamibacteria bacterium]|nr:M20/M25/M40 family metallo-hydrolase [Vicinamibacteria bacterium]